MTEKAFRVRVAIALIVAAHLPFLIASLFNSVFIFPMLIIDAILIIVAASVLAGYVCDDDGWKAICKLMDWKWAGS